MINVAALRMQQFGVQFYQASLTAKDIDKLVRFEVLSYADQTHAPVRGGRRGTGPRSTGTCWSAGSHRATRRTSGRSSAARSTSSCRYYDQCRQARDLPSIPGAVIISCDERLRFEPVSPGASAGTLKVPEREGILRAIDGQHRLLALHAALDQIGQEPFTVPAIIFDQLPEDHIVQMFVTINAKHTRLNASHLVSLSGRQLYRDDNLAAAHDVVRALNDREDSPLYQQIKLLGVGRGKVAQAPLAQELKKLLSSDAFGTGRRAEDFREESKRFFVNYLKQVAQVFGAAWNGRKYSIRSAPALRAFIRVAPDVIRRLDQERADRADFRAIGRVIAPWGRRIGDLRFETEGAWKRNGSSVEQLAKELRLALQYPEGAGI